VFRAEVAELQHKVMSLQVEAMELKQALEVAKASGVGASAQLQGQLDASVADCAQLRAEAQALRQERAALQVDLAALESKSAQQAADFERRLSEAQASGAGAASAELDSLRAKLASAENEVASLNQALESVAAKAVETAEQHEKEVKALQQQLAAASAAAAQASSDGGRADAEELKAIMQDVFVKAGEVFDTEGPDSAEAQYSALDVVKRLKGVLKKVTAERSASV
jgi:chromosome segregation ATPase